MNFEGEMSLPRPVELVWRRLSDVRFLVGSIPGTEAIREAAEDRAICVLRPGLSFAKGTLELTVERTAAEPATGAAYRMLSKGIGSSSEVQSQLRFQGREDVTLVAWTAEIVSLGGLLKAVPKGLIRGAAQKTIEDVWARVAARVAEEG